MRPAIIVSDETARIVEFGSDFINYAKRNGITNPIHVSMTTFAKHIRDRGIIDINLIKEEEYVSEAEIEAFHKMREEYIANRVFKEIGYERFLKYISPNYIYMETEDRFVPCKSADRQCNIFCHRYAECLIEGTWKPE